MARAPRKFAPLDKYDPRQRFAGVCVLVADRDVRISGLVKRVLRSFGFLQIEVVNSGEGALNKLRQEKFDLIITEWHMQPVNGVDLARAIRMAKDEQRLRRDIPIIMLTARGQKESVEEARDAGVNEFLVKPFSAHTLSNRLIQVIDKPRVFVESPGFVGPCRRRRGEPPPGTEERRAARKPKGTEILPANTSIRDLVGIDAAKIINAVEIKRAQSELLAAEGDFLEWAKDDVSSLEKAFAELTGHPGDIVAHAALLDVAYAIKSQAGIFGYDLGTEVGGMLVEYLTAHTPLDANKLVVVRKCIDTISVIFRQKMKEAGQAVGRELISSLHQLIEKLG